MVALFVHPLLVRSGHMTSPSGSVRIEVEADASDFERSLQRAVADAMRDVQRDLARDALNVAVDLNDFQAEVRRGIDEAQRYANTHRIQLGVDIDSAGAATQMRATHQLLESIATPIRQQVDVEVNQPNQQPAPGGGNQQFTWSVDLDVAAAMSQFQALQQQLNVGSTPVTIPVDIDGAGALAQIALLRQQLEGFTQPPIVQQVNLDQPNTGPIQITAEPDFTGFAQQVNAQLQAIQQANDWRLTIPVDIGSAAAVAQMAQLRQQLEAQARTITQRVEIDVDRGGLDQASNSARSLGSSLSSLGGLSGGIAAVAGGIAAIGGAAGAAAGAVGGLVVAAGALAPAFAAGISTAVVAMQGVKDAFDAATDAAENAPQEAEAQAKAVASAANQVEAAERAVRQAKKDAQTAEEDLTRARKAATEQLEDMHFAALEGVLDERQAVRDLRKAQQDLAKVNPFDGEAREEAIDRVARAQLRLERVQDRNSDNAEKLADAERKGIEGSDQVVAAKDRQANANDNLAQAQRQLAQAQTALAEAQTAALPSAEKLDQALAKLAPNARDFVLASRDLADEWTEVRKAVQDNFFDGLDQTVRDLADAVLPTLQAGMSAVATEMNLGARGFADFLSSAEGVRGLDAVFTSTEGLLRGMREGSEGFLSSLSEMAVAAQPFAETIGRAFGSIGTALGDAFSEMASSGLLGRVLEGLASALEGLGPLLGDLFTTFAELGARVLPALQPLFVALGDALVAMAPALGDLGRIFADSLTALMPSLSSLISALATGLQPVLPVIANLLGAVAAAIQPMIGPLSQVAVVVGTAITDAVNALAPALGPLAQSFADMVTAVAPLVPLLADSLSVILQALAPALSQIAVALAPVIAQFAEQMKPVIEQLAPILAQTAMIIGVALADAIRQIAPVLPQIVLAFTNMLLAVAPLLPEFAKLAAEILPPLVRIWVEMTPVTIKLIEALTWLVTQVLPIVISHWEIMGSTLSTVLTIVGDAIVFWKEVFRQAFIEVKGFWDDFMVKVDGVKSWFTDTLLPAIGNGIETLKGWFETGVRGISTAWNGLMDAAKVPVKFVVETVWNNGLLKAWNAAAKFLPGVDPMEPITLPFNRGGVLPGYTPGKDVHKFISTDGRMGLALSGGEGIARPEVVRAMGTGRWDAMNAAARSGGVAGVRRFMGFATGGVIPTRMWELISERWPDMVWTSGYRDTPDYHGANMAGDFATPQVPSRTMQEVAKWIYETYGPETLELIHWPLNGWENIDNGAPFNFGQPTNDQHRSHVHWAMDHPPGDPGDKKDSGGFLGAIRRAGENLLGGVKDKVADVFDGIVSGIAGAIPEFGGLFGQLPRTIFESFRTKMREFITGKGGEEDSKRESVPVGGDVELFRPLVRDLLKHYQLPLTLTNNTMRRMQQESSGRVDAVNLDDINAQNGTPSVGLMQVIGPTYSSYKDPAFDKGPYLYGVSIDPAANISASMRYALARYGDLISAYDRAGGYQVGGLIPGVGTGDIVPALLEPREFVMNRRATARFGPLLRAMNAAVPRFQTGGDVGGLIGGMITVPVVVTNWEAARGILGGAAQPAPEASVLVPTAPTVPVAPADPTSPGSEIAPAAAGAAGNVVDAIGQGVATAVADSLRALVDSITDREAAERRVAEQALMADDQAAMDEQGRILTDTRDILARTESSQQLVLQEQFEQLRAQVAEVAGRLSGGVLIPIVETAMDQALGVVKDLLGAGFAEVTDGTDRTTAAVKDLDLDASSGAGAAVPPPFGAPGSAFDAASAISEAVTAVANTARQAFERVAQDIANAALAQRPSRVDNSRGVLGRDISGGPLVDMIVRLTGVEIEIRDNLENTLKEIQEFRGDLVSSFDESGRLVSDTATLMQRNESSRDLVIAEQNRVNRELIKAVLRYLISSVLLPIITAILGAMIQLAATAIGAAIGSIIPGIGTAIGAAVGAVVGAALAGTAAIFTSMLAVGAGAALDAFDSGGVAYGKGLMVKDTNLPERVLSPRETSSYDRLGRIADFIENNHSSKTTQVHAPITVRGDERAGERVHNYLTTLMAK